MDVMMLRAIYAVIAVGWFYVLATSMAAGRIGGKNGFQDAKGERPLQYWGLILVFMLMFEHFAVLTAMGPGAFA